LIDPLREEVISPNEATNCYQRNSKGKKVHVSKVYRDMKFGQNGIKLESIRTPRLATSREAIARFFRAVTEARQKQDLQSTLTEPARSRNEETIERELDRLGI
jgi:hypothetical protein